MARSEADRTVAAVAKAMAGDHPPEIQRILASIAARAVEADDDDQSTGDRHLNGTPACG